MPTKKGNLLHSKGNKLPFSNVVAVCDLGYARAVADALRSEATRSGVSAKTVMRWTGASERTVKGWMSGRQGPSGAHLLALMKQSDAVWITVLRLAGRAGARSDEAIATARHHLAEAERALAVLSGKPKPLREA